MRRFFRTTYAFAVILVFIVVALLGFTQTKIFRSYLRSRLIETSATALHAQLTLGPIEGNLFTGFHADSLLLSRNGDTLLSVRRVDARYDPIGALAKRVSVSSITLTHPLIKLKRTAGGAWNIDGMFQSSSDESSSSSWTINLKKLQIVGGEVHLVDSLDLAAREADSSLQISPGRIDYANLHLDSLLLDAGLNISGRRIQLALRSFACNLVRPEFQIKALEGDFLLDESVTEIRKLNVLTGQSHVSLSARLDSVDITKIHDLAQLQYKPVSLQVSVGRLDFGELKQWIGKPVAFLEREVAGQIDVEGRFGALDVRNVTLHSGTTSIRIAGTLTNLHHPKDLELDLACVRNKVDPDDVRRLMPTLRIPDLSAFGAVEYDLRFVGKPLAFSARLSSNSRVGRIDVDGKIDLREPQISYDGVLRTAQLDLARLTGDSSMVSRLRSTITFQGRGMRLADMSGLVRADIDSSEFYGLPLNRSVVVVDVASKIIHPRVSLRLGSARIDIGGTLQLKPQDIVGFDLAGRINSLNLADVLKKEEPASDVSFDVQTQGDFKSVSELSGRATLNFFRSSVDTVQFAGGPAIVKLNTLDAAPHILSITSEVVDLEATGTFTPSSLISSMARGVALAGQAIAYRISALDALRGSPDDQRPVKEFRSSVPSRRDTVDYTFTLNMKDCYPLGVILSKELEGSFGLNGRVRDNSDAIQMNLKADVEAFHYGDEKLSLGMTSGEITVKADGLSPQDLLHSMSISLGAAAKRFDAQGLQTANLSLHLAMADDSSRFDIGGLLDSVATVNMHGSMKYVNRFFLFTLDRLQADFSSHVFGNSEPVLLRVGRDGLQASNLMLHHDAEEVSVMGLFNPAGQSNLAASVHNVQIGSIPKIVRRTASIESLPSMSGVVNANATFDGSLEEPSFSLDMNAAGVSYDQQRFGTVLVRSSYADRLLTIFAQLNSHGDSVGSVPELRLNGTVPYDLALSGTSDRK
ncbi:MAG TPA: AsmA family protein, partial [Bacteroidota bacterium]|nr:AsmA family protein [Bacteroidota bacterium]